MKIGVLGGSFDPIHNGHLYMACCAHESFALDQVWLIPAGHSPNKNESTMTPAEDRFKMCEIAAEKYDWLYASRFEIDSGDRSYTYRTLQKLTKVYPADEFYFIMGGDSLDYFEEWCHPEIIASLCTILVVPRDQFDTVRLEEKIQELRAKFACDIRIVHCREYPISSTQLREVLKTGKQTENDVLPQVLAYIQEKHLYGVG